MAAILQPSDQEQKKSFFKADYRQLLADATYIMTVGLTLLCVRHSTQNNGPRQGCACHMMRRSVAGLMPGDDGQEIEVNRVTVSWPRRVSRVTFRSCNSLA
eukprot:6419035-Amphidinium_carterae.1